MSAPAAGRPDPRAGPLAGMRILELGGGQPGAYACWVLAQLGAEVIVLECGRPPDGGPSGADEIALHLGKRRLALDARRAEGRGVALRIAGGADALVSSIAPAAARECGLDAESVRAVSPAIVYAQATASGSIGASAD